VSVDWLGDFEKKFESNNMIANLKKSGFHGKVIVNFCAGSPNTAHLEWVVKPYVVTSPHLVRSGEEDG